MRLNSKRAESRIYWLKIQVEYGRFSGEATRRRLFSPIAGDTQGFAVRKMLLAIQAEDMTKSTISEIYPAQLKQKNWFAAHSAIYYIVYGVRRWYSIEVFSARAAGGSGNTRSE
jgi:hypothetical protein